TNWPYQPSSYGLMVEGTNILSAAQPYYYYVPPTPVTLNGTDLYLPPTTVTNPFPGTMNYGSLVINWQFSNDGGISWSSAGQTSNELYVTLGAPDVTPVYHTVINISVPPAGMIAAAVNSALLNATWTNFQNRTLTTKHILQVQNGVPLTYYAQCNTTLQHVGEPLSAANNRGRAGRCGALAELFVRT